MVLKIYNTLHKEEEVFEPITNNTVGLYTCGMTVYDYAHIGHGRKYTMDDVLRRTLTRFGYAVNHVQNVTDVGHLTGENEGDADKGEDKMEKGALKAGKTVWEVAQFFTDDFYTAMDKLNVLRPNIVAKATEHIPEQITLIEKLIARGHAYETPEAVYFDVASFPAYGALSGQKLSDKRVAVREEVETGSYKRGPHDFALWFKRIGRFENHTMYWPSPWGDGFPGWHIECSAMSMKYLGETFDIHTGGIDHIPVHHENEIAQSECGTGKEFVKYWMHYAFLNVNGEKMSKSLGNYVRIQDVIDRGYNPLSLRYFYFGSQYRSSLNFTWEALSGASEALKRLYNIYRELGDATGTVIEKYKMSFDEALGNDLNTPQALAVLWELAKDTTVSEKDKKATFIDFDQVLGLNFDSIENEPLPDAILKLKSARETARDEKDWAKSDELRKEIEMLGYTVKDTEKGQSIFKE